MPLMVGKRKSPENGLKLRIQVACCATEMVIMPLPASPMGAEVAWVAVVAVGSDDAVVGAVVAAAGTGVAVGEAGVVSQAVRTREKATNNGNNNCNLEWFFTRIKF